MNQTYIEARATQLMWLLPHLHAEHDRLKDVGASQLTGEELNAHSRKMLRRQAAEIEHDIEELQ